MFRFPRPRVLDGWAAPGVACLWLSLPAMCAGGAPTGYATLTTDYMYRGVSLSDGNPALQLGLDFESGTGVFAGLWASTADIESGADNHRDREVDYYAGYGRALGRWGLDATVIRYTYPAARGFDYDFSEYAVTASRGDRWWLEFAWAPRFLGHDLAARHWELSTRWPLRWGLSAGAGLAYFDLSAGGDAGYWHWQAGLTRSFDRVSLDLRYYDADGAPPGVRPDLRARARLVASISAAF